MSENLEQWYPVKDADRLGELAQWLAFAEGITGTASAAFHDRITPQPTVGAII